MIDLKAFRNFLIVLVFLIPRPVKAQDSAILIPFLEQEVVTSAGILAKAAETIASLRQMIGQAQDLISLKEGLDAIPLVYELKALYGEGLALFEEIDKTMNEFDKFQEFLQGLDDIEVDTSNPRMLKIKVGAETYREQLHRRLNDREKAFLEHQAWSKAWDRAVNNFSEKASTIEGAKLLKKLLDLQTAINERAEMEREQREMQAIVDEYRKEQQKEQEKKYLEEIYKNSREAIGVFNTVKFGGFNPYKYEKHQIRK